jgi:CRISPR-associated protein Csx17
MLIAEQRGLKQNPLDSQSKVSLKDVTVFIEGSVDDERLEALLFAFALIDWKKARWTPASGREEAGVWPVYALLKHLFCPDKIKTGEEGGYMRADPGVLAALMAGDVERAARIGSRRLQNAGMPRAEIQDAGGLDGMRLAAALLIPVPYGPAMQRFFTTTTGDRQ